MVSIELESFNITLNGDPVTIFVKKGTEAAVESGLQLLGQSLTVAQRRPQITQTKDSGKIVTRVTWAGVEYDCTPVPPPKDVPMPDAEAADSDSPGETSPADTAPDAPEASTTPENAASKPSE